MNPYESLPPSAFWRSAVEHTAARGCNLHPCSEADQTALNNILPISESKLKFIVNGVDLIETESVLGDLPKKRSLLRKKIKNIFKFQFFSEKYPNKNPAAIRNMAIGAMEKRKNNIASKDFFIHQKTHHNETV